ncbi:hypothetical protein [Brachyspira hyodysenteriae]|uniref:hypothetical protein n=1 Tax=Brachyspira hyodysenteriae TaxID=159 RepID=UPI00063DBBAA|nr:hypothetical protein [Brachyspira hyodysenteriae]KLI18798.1 hypothetical protein SU45_01880 [Brachyspira hyodysenteriae]KLI30778.1 hypothetical protein SZ49_05720 [Brachyspira hyodysenteriae]KLI54230.1 hypothetical protein SZ43_04280 [Brachyspira hyodysenteriae]KLI61956.1 hypothetical protein SZ46_04205 [Brachyspira hyodysenteriae]MCZ9850219.1 hypothetical protein [Brachyspira hyodysenteriae]
MKASIDLEIHETTGRSRSGQMFKDYNLTYKPKSIPDLIKYLESKKYKIIAFDTTHIRDENKISICIDKKKVTRNEE